MILWNTLISFDYDKEDFTLTGKAGQWAQSIKLFTYRRLKQIPF
jgi:hypothetical protein